MTTEGGSDGTNPPRGQEAIWDYFQTEAPGSFSGAEPRLRHLAGMLGPGMRVLNIGAGSGLFEEIAANAGIQIHSLDPSRKTIEGVQRRLGLLDRAKVGYSNKIPFESGYFDAVVASEVLEHLSQDVLISSLSEIARVLVAGGRLLGTVPSRDPLETHTVVCPNCAFRFHRWGHVQSFTPDLLRSALSGVFVEIFLEERAFISWKQLNWKGKILGVFKLIFSRLGFHGSNENYVFVARKP